MKCETMSKQVTTPQQTAGVTSPQDQNNLFISVKTFDTQGKTVGERIVDMYHFGTRNWLQQHTWWAMHNGHDVETKLATPDEVKSYLAMATQALANKFNSKVVEEPPAPAAEKAAA
jgi:hypothetical protein